MHHQALMRGQRQSPFVEWTDLNVALQRNPARSARAECRSSLSWQMPRQRIASHLAATSPGRCILRLHIVVLRIPHAVSAESPERLRVASYRGSAPGASLCIGARLLELLDLLPGAWTISGVRSPKKRSKRFQKQTTAFPRRFCGRFHDINFKCSWSVLLAALASLQSFAVKPAWALPNTHLAYIQVAFTCASQKRFSTPGRHRSAHSASARQVPFLR